MAVAGSSAASRRRPMTITQCPPRRFQPRMLGDLKPKKAGWVVEGLIPAEGVTFLYGPSGAGKSFLAIDVAYRLC
ncbi:MAG: AAA family ATPase, partial [bacterium]